MTPAVVAAQRAKVAHRVHSYAHDPARRAFGEEAAEALGLPRERVFKTLVAALDGDSRRLAVAVVPVSAQLDLKAFAAAIGAKKAALAEAAAAERATGYVVGGISPLGQKRRLPALLDRSALHFETLFVSAGRRGLEIELAPADLQRLIGAKVAEIART
ncbi:Cys-tRNA(Pro) deacylase [Endothiovibrio diazotrophicus]